MPCDYSKYPPNWKTEIRPRILAREGNCCKWCKAPNRTVVCRGTWGGIPVWQNDDGQIFRADNGEQIGESYVGDVWEKGVKPSAPVVILTIAHLDHDTTNNEDTNLAALCQRCHLNHDRDLHRDNARKTRERKKGQGNLF